MKAVVLDSIKSEINLVLLCALIQSEINLLLVLTLIDSRPNWIIFSLLNCSLRFFLWLPLFIVSFID